MISQTVVETVALAVLLTALFVAWRLLGCLITSLRARRYQISIVSVIGFICIAGALGIVVIV